MSLKHLPATFPIDRSLLESPSYSKVATALGKWGVGRKKGRTGEREERREGGNTVSKQ